MLRNLNNNTHSRQTFVLTHTFTHINRLYFALIVSVTVFIRYCCFVHSYICTFESNVLHMYIICLFAILLSLCVRCFREFCIGILMHAAKRFQCAKDFILLCIFLTSEVRYRLGTQMELEVIL